MSEKSKRILCALLAAVVLIGLLLGRSEKGTIIEFVEDAVVIEMDSGTRVVRIEDYHAYIPAGEQWSVGDRVRLREGGILCGLSIRRLPE